MGFDLSFALQVFVTLVVIMDPPGAAPIFLSLVGKSPEQEQRRMAWQAAGTSLLVITIFALFGRWILDYLNISITSLKAAGGLLLLLVSLDLLRGLSLGKEKEGHHNNAALVPLGTPLLAGPGAIVTIMIFVDEAVDSSKIIGLGLAVIATHLVIAISLMFASKIILVIRESGVDLLSRIAGLLLSAIAVEMIFSTVKEYFF